MYDTRNVKSERILTKLRVLDYEYICNRIAKFHKKILFITRVINIQILTTKYFSFQYSVTCCSQAVRRPAHRARETVHLLLGVYTLQPVAATRCCNAVAATGCKV